MKKDEIKALEETFKPHQLQIIVTDAKGAPIKATMSLIDIQQMFNEHGDDAVSKAIYKVFKDLVDKMKK